MPANQVPGRDLSAILAELGSAFAKKKKKRWWGSGRDRGMISPS
jgi:hypothetical protein